MNRSVGLIEIIA